MGLRKPYGVREWFQLQAGVCHLRRSTRGAGGGGEGCMSLLQMVLDVSGTLGCWLGPGVFSA